MRVTHKLVIASLCPANGSTDEYETTIEVARFLQAEEIVEKVKKYRDQKIWQEDLTRLLAQELDATVTTCGCHGEIVTEVTVGN